MVFCILFSPTAAWAAVDCTSYIDTRKDIVWYPVKEGIEKLHFLAPTSADRPNCPGADGCELPAFLVGGDQVIVTTTAYEPVHKRSLICGVYISPKGVRTFGWLDKSGFYGGGNIMNPIDNPKIFGDWFDGGGGEITIRSGQDDHILIDGNVTLGPPSYRSGTISGSAFIGGVGDVAGYSASHYNGSSPAIRNEPADGGCRVRFRFTGYYLLVDDNDICGGQGVSFDNVYVKKSLKK